MSNTIIPLTNTIIGAAHRVFRGSGAPTDGTDEVQSIDITGVPTGGTFRLAFGVYRTAPIDFDADAAELEAALLALSVFDEGDLEVSGDNPNFSVTFGGNYGLSDQPLFTLYENLLTGGTTPNVTFTEDTPGVASTLPGQGVNTVYVDEDTGELYVRASGGWALVGDQTAT